MNERWLPIAGFEGSYEVSDQGRVRSLARTITRGDGMHQPVPERILRATVGNHGYPNVHLQKPGVKSMRTVHTLVLEAFVGPRPDGADACHENGNRIDPRLSNLRWDTRSANVRDSIRQGTHSMTRRTHCPFGHLLASPNLVACAARDGHRTCLACSRARAYARWHHINCTQELRDDYYSALSR